MKKRKPFQKSTQQKTVGNFFPLASLIESIERAIESSDRHAITLRLAIFDADAVPDGFVVEIENMNAEQVKIAEIFSQQYDEWKSAARTPADYFELAYFKRQCEHLRTRILAQQDLIHELKSKVAMLASCRDAKAE